jgi:hypothetical protein
MKIEHTYPGRKARAADGRTEHLLACLFRVDVELASSHLYDKGIFPVERVGSGIVCQD